MLLRRLLAKFSSIRDRIKQERENRLNKSKDDGALTLSTSSDLEKVRNIGIIAHIDAGKTTTTERMLYYAGALASPGDVDDGNTTMDYLKQERERGITIRSAAISFNWEGHQINLIDTPGHVDFSGEVSRSTRILDGVVTILDGVKGVEAQTVKVWELATKMNLPKVCYINKMDRIGASVLRTAEAIKDRLKVEPLIMQHQVGEAESLSGVIDLPDMKQFTFSGAYGQIVTSQPVGSSHPLFQKAISMRQELIEKVGNFHDGIGEAYLQEKAISGRDLHRAIRQLLLNEATRHLICPILLGSSFKNRGVQSLLDYVVHLLPAPSQRPPIFCSLNPKQSRRPTNTDPLVCYVFKVIWDEEMGPLAYTRIYSGVLKKNEQIYNCSRDESDKIGVIYRVRANQYVPVSTASAGDIVAISGSRAVAGETFVANGTSPFLLQKLQLPSPVFTVPFQVLAAKDLRPFKEFVNRAVIEDNSLIYKQESETGQHLLSGLGELHLEILRDQMIERGIAVRMGSLKINYKESVAEPISHQIKINNEVKPGLYEEIQLEIKLIPRDQNQLENRILFSFPSVAGFQEAWSSFLAKKSVQPKTNAQQGTQVIKAQKYSRNPNPMVPAQYSGMFSPYSKRQTNSVAKQGESNESEVVFNINTLPFETLYDLYETCKVAAMHGKFHFPTTGIDVAIVDGYYRKSTFSKVLMNRCATQVLRELIDKNSILLEPVLEVVLEGEAKMLELMVPDILKRRGQIEESTDMTVMARVPAASVRGWVKILRGMGLQIDMKFKSYEPVSGIDPKVLASE